jgi:hypothetical protein
MAGSLAPSGERRGRKAARGVRRHRYAEALAEVPRLTLHCAVLARLALLAAPATQRTGPLLLVAVAACCSHTALDAANHRRDELRAALVDDYHPDVPPAASCGDVPVVSFDDMRSGAHAGELVAVDGLPVGPTEMMCTQALCTDDCDRPLPCCNGCSGGLALLVAGDRKARIALEGPGLSCSGYECAMQCRPFGAKPTRNYRFVGRYTTGRNPNGYTWTRLSAERWCHVP